MYIKRGQMAGWYRVPFRDIIVVKKRGIEIKMFYKRDKRVEL